MDNDIEVCVHCSQSNIQGATKRLTHLISHPPTQFYTHLPEKKMRFDTAYQGFLFMPSHKKLCLVIDVSLKKSNGHYQNIFKLDAF